MSNQLIITVDTAAGMAAFTAVPDAVARRLKEVDRITADHIAREAKARIRRRTGATGEAITVEETHDGQGYIVFVGGGRTNIGRYLEFGTEFMTPKPFLFVSARLEEGPHERRATEAVQAGIDELGLGDAVGAAA